MDVKKQIESIIVRKPAVKLDAGELYLYQVDCKYGKQVEKTTATTKTGPGIGVAVPVTKRFGIGISRHKVKTTIEKEMVWDQTKCTALLTSSRFLFKIGKDVNQIDFDKIEDIKINKDAITIVSRGTPYHFFMKNSEVQRFMQVWGLLGEAQKQGIKMSDIK